ncbi:MAG TPA: VOC family protein [Ilumatobacter sp.]|nr:VOC family protein [Ilumatobacter sp.]
MSAVATYLNFVGRTEEAFEADDLFAKLSVGGEVHMPLTDMFWGDYFGSFRDQFGVGWMFNVTEQGAA